MSEHTEQPERSTDWPATIALLALLLAYPFSYAPVVQMRGGWKMVPATDGFGNPAVVKAPIFSEDLPLYRPVDWLIDNTPMQDVLYWWADVWGVRSPFTEAAGCVRVARSRRSARHHRSPRDGTHDDIQ
jgi:hypothetical protein